MKIAIYGTKGYDKDFLISENLQHKHTLLFFEETLSLRTAALAQGCQGVCVFVNDRVDGACLTRLAELGVTIIALRCAGFNNVDIETAEKLGVSIVRVPEYSPHGVAEHALALILGLNRKLYRAYNRVRENNFLLDGLLGFNLHGKTVGVIGTGKIGAAFCHIMRGFGCRILAYDVAPNPACKNIGVDYVPLDRIFHDADIISLHCPLTPSTHHLIDRAALAKMKPGVMVINTSRGALIDTPAMIGSLKSAHVGYLGLDVYEEEGDLFFEDVSNKILDDDVFARLLTFPNVLITGHQAFFTREALENIAQTTLENFTLFEGNRATPNAVTLDMIKKK